MPPTAETTTSRASIRDSIFVELALRNGKIPLEAIQKGKTSLEEMARFGISRPLSAVLVDRKLIDRNKEKELLREFAKIQIQCPRCRKAVGLEELIHKENLRCGNCRSTVGVELKPAEGKKGEKQSRIEDRLKGILVKAGDEPGPVAGILRGGPSYAAIAPVAKTPRPQPTQPSPEKGKSAGEPAAAAEEQPAVRSRQALRAALRKYRIEGVVSTGPYGRLYRARPAAAGEGGPLLALKVLSPHLLSAEKEARTLKQELGRFAGLDPEYPLPTHGLDEESSVFYMLRPFLAWPMVTLEDLSLEDAGQRADVLWRITRRLKAIHDAGAVHGNLKPSNIFIHRENLDQVMLVDPALHLLHPRDRIARWKVLADAPRYRSPEEIAGAAPTPASDIYALGWIFYAVTAGALPFAGAAPPDVLRRHQEGPCPELPAEAGDWRVLHLSMTAVAPQERPANAGAVLTHLEAIRAGKKLALAAPAPRASAAAAEPLAPAAKKRPFFWWYLAGPAALAAVITWVSFCWVTWNTARAMFSAPDRSRVLYQHVAEDAFRRTELEVSAEPERGREIWQKYIEKFEGTALVGAAEARRADFPAPAPPPRSPRPAPAAPR